MKLPTYQKYKPSGVEWLGDVPEHWAAQGVKFCYSIQLGKMLQPEPASPTDEETPYLKSQHVQWEHVRVADLPTMWTNKKERRQYAVKDGDLLVCEGGDVGRAAVVRGATDGTIIQNALHRVRPLGENETGFLLYVLAHAASQGWFEIICNKSTIAHFTVDKFGALGVALPTPAEQRSIAAFLDRETERVDRLVAKKRELIERLKEKRTALISRTVTRGLPPTAAKAAGLPASPPLKPSGIDWLGDIPKHWEEMTIKRVALSMICGPFGSSLTKDKYTESGYRVYGQEQVIPGDFSIGDYYISTDYFSEMKRYEVRAGDVLVSCVGTFGKVAVVPEAIEPGIINPRLILIRPDRRRIDSEYMGILIRSHFAHEQLQATSRGGTMDIINLGLMGDLMTPLPPLPEQAAIASFLDRETAKLDALVGKVEEAVERLQEYRTALITAAVTGKIDVRNEQT